MKYNKKADAYLAKLYKSVGAKTWEQKFNTLELALGVVPGSSTFSHPEIGWRSKCGCLEYELLERRGLIELVLV